MNTVAFLLLLSSAYAVETAVTEIESATELGGQMQESITKDKSDNSDNNSGEQESLSNPDNMPASNPAPAAQYVAASTDALAASVEEVDNKSENNKSEVDNRSEVDNKSEAPQQKEKKPEVEGQKGYVQMAKEFINTNVETAKGNAQRFVPYVVKGELRAIGAAVAVVLLWVVVPWFIVKPIMSMISRRAGVLSALVVMFLIIPAAAFIFLTQNKQCDQVLKLINPKS